MSGQLLQLQQQMHYFAAAVGSGDSAEGHVAAACSVAAGAPAGSVAATAGTARAPRPVGSWKWGAAKSEKGERTDQTATGKSHSEGTVDESWLNAQSAGVHVQQPSFLQLCGTALPYALGSGKRV